MSSCKYPPVQIGDRYNMLAVVGVEKDKKGVKYICQCDCGGRTTARGYELRSGKKWCCGCKTKVTCEKRRKNYVGQKFNKLTVIEMLYNYNSCGQAYVRCVCDCGNETIKPCYGVTSGIIKSCGCDSRERTITGSRKDLTGQRFGRLVVQEMLWQYQNKKNYCRCLCDCGNEKIVQNTMLTCGDTVSCGCYHRERTQELFRKDYTGMTNAYGTRLLRRTTERNSQGQEMWECQCGGCGSIFLASPTKVLNNHNASCGCVKSSNAEILIRDLLFTNDVQYIPEYRFDDCCDIRALPFDFYLTEYNKIIEYNGRQHFEPIEFFGGQSAFELRRKHDAMKRAYCEQHNIPLLDLPYYLSHDEIKQQIIDFINA